MTLFKTSSGSPSETDYTRVPSSDLVSFAVDMHMQGFSSSFYIVSTRPQMCLQKTKRLMLSPAEHEWDMAFAHSNHPQPIYLSYFQRFHAFFVTSMRIERGVPKGSRAFAPYLRHWWRWTLSQECHKKLYVICFRPWLRWKSLDCCGASCRPKVWWDSEAVVNQTCSVHMFSEFAKPCQAI
jgi:hypothetical protein